MPYVSHAAAAKARLRAAQDAGLVAASVLLQNRMKVALRKGYTSGDFITGRSVNAVARTRPHDADGGGRQVEVGTSLLYNLFWEIGHVNRWTRKYERVEKWRPTLLDSRTDLQREFARIVALVMQRSAAAPAAGSEAAD